MFRRTDRRHLKGQMRNQNRGCSRRYLRRSYKMLLDWQYLLPCALDCGSLALVDLVLVIGTSLKVAPVSEVVGVIPPQVPQIFISREPCGHAEFDIDLLGDCDVVLEALCRVAGWRLDHDMTFEGRIRVDKRVGYQSKFEIDRVLDENMHVEHSPEDDSTSTGIVGMDKFVLRPRSPVIPESESLFPSSKDYLDEYLAKDQTELQALLGGSKQGGEGFEVANMGGKAAVLSGKEKEADE